MRISLKSGATLYPLAGEAGVSERVHSSAADFQMAPMVGRQQVARVRAEYGEVIDRGNLLHQVSFSTTRLLSTPAEALLWCLDYDTAFPRSGTLLLDAVAPNGSWERRSMVNAVVNPPTRRIIGASVLLDYTIEGGAIAADTEAVAASVTLDPAGTNNSVTFTAVTPGSAGNNIQVALGSNSNPVPIPTIGVVGNYIQIIGGAPTTAQDVIDAVNAHPAASALVTASASGLATGLIASVAATNLTGGAD